MDTNSDTDTPPEGSGGERIAKRLARAGLCSRRDAERWIAEGRVAVNGKLLDSPACVVKPGDDVIVDGKPVPEAEPTRLWRYHKPAGLVTTARDEKGRATVFDKLPADLPRVVSVGRLDLTTEGLLLLTNDGELARFLELPATGWTRRYRVRVHGTVDETRLAGLTKGVTIDGVQYGPIEALLDRVQGSNAWLTVAIKEGKNREIRKVMESLELSVTRLIRTAYGPFQLGKLPEGEVEEVPKRVVKDQVATFFAERDGVPEEPKAGGTAKAAPKPTNRGPHKAGPRPEPKASGSPIRAPKPKPKPAAEASDGATEAPVQASARRPARTSDERPRNDRPFGKGRPSAKAAAEAADRAVRAEGRPRGERTGGKPARRSEEFGERTSVGERKPTSERPGRPGGKPAGKPAGDAPSRRSEDRGDRPFGKPTGERKSAGERKPAGERSGRPGGAASGRPQADRSAKPGGKPAGGAPGRRSEDHGERSFGASAGERKPGRERSGKPAGAASGRPQADRSAKPGGKPPVTGKPGAAPKGAGPRGASPKSAGPRDSGPRNGGPRTAGPGSGGRADRRR